MTNGRTLVIKIPFKTPSINHLHVRTRWGMCLSSEANKLKKDIKAIVEPMQGTFLTDEKLSLHVDVCESWYTLKGKFRRRDVANREKFLTDSICEGLGVDDSQVFEISMRKVDSKNECSIVTIKPIL